MAITRRQLLRGTAGAGLGLLVAGGATSLRVAGPAIGRSLGLGAGGGGRNRFGSLRPDPAGLLDLPAGFSYQVVTQAGRPMVGPSGDGVGAVPGLPDGTAAFPGDDGHTLLVMNHEQSLAAPYPVAGSRSLTYDPAALGGTTTLVLDPSNRLVEQYVSLAGTHTNCAGGVTPWGTWLTCEETEQRADATFGRDHGFVFEVEPLDPAANANPAPLTAMGRFPHEAAVVDPQRGHVYLTEDAEFPSGLLYRFTPAERAGRRHSLRAGGLLEAMRIAGIADLSSVGDIGTRLPVEWVPVPDPVASAESTRRQFSYLDFSTGATIAGPGGAVTRAHKLEGAWWAGGRAVVVTSYARGDADWSAAAHDGQVWAYDPASSSLELKAFFPFSPGTEDRPGGPDNITANPWGGLFVAEDGEGTQHLLAVAADGTPSVFARNAVSYSEFTGVTFSPDARTLFANIQDEGYVLAITGPFERA